MVLTGYVWTVGETGEKNISVFKSTPISVNEVLITYANYLHLIIERLKELCHKNSDKLDNYKMPFK